MKNNIFEESLLQFYSDQQLTNIQSQKIGICGAGGLGSIIAVLLVRSGFKHFEICDKDKVEASNLNRQHFYCDNIGDAKVISLNDHLLNINKDCDVTSKHITWKKEIAHTFFKDCNIIVEAVDQAKTKCEIIEYYQNKSQLLVSGNGMAGCAPSEPMPFKQINNVFIVGDQKTGIDPTHPPLAPRVTMCAAMMAEIILDHILATNE